MAIIRVEFQMDALLEQRANTTTTEDSLPLVQIT